MNSESSVYDDCCLLWDVCLSAERVSTRLVRRFQSNSIRTSFDFKSFLPDQPSDNVKIARSLLNVRPLRINSITSDEDSTASDSVEDEPELIVSVFNDFDDDEYLERLVTFEDWDKNETIVHSDEDDAQEEVHQEYTPAHSGELLPSRFEGNDHIFLDIPTSEVEDVLVTFTHRPVKAEPMIPDNNSCHLPQLDGRTDFEHKHRKKRLAHSSKSMPSSSTKPSPITIKPFSEAKAHPSINTSRSSHPKKRKRSSKTQSARTLFDYFPVIQHSPKTNNRQYPSKSSKNRTRERSASYFDGCIVIDDDDDSEETQQPSHPICTNIRNREKLLDYAIRSPSMRLQWLVNLEFVLLEHISICRQTSLHPSETFDSTLQIKCEPSHSYSIDPSFISMIITNFLDMFVVGDTSFEQKELLLYQYGFTSHLRYLLIELPTYNHDCHSDEMSCSQCDEYSSVVNLLFDLLFDLIEFDLCEVPPRGKFRSSLIKDGDFQQMNIRKRNPFERIKFVFYFIELIGLHRDKCSNPKDPLFHTNEDKIFQWMEQFIYQIAHERITICFNAMELCLLFAKEKEQRVKQMALFLVKIYEENSGYLHLFLFDENLLPDIRLLFLNELILKRFNMKLISSDALDEFFQRIEVIVRSADTHAIDDTTLLLTRSLLSTYADLQLDIKHPRQFTSMLATQLEAIHLTLLTIRSNIERTEIFFRLLKCRWKRIRDEICM